MKEDLLIAAALAIVSAFFEFCQHNDYHKKHPDYERSHTGIIGFVIIALFCIIKSFI